MARRKEGKKLTLSEHLALRARAMEQSKAREEARLHSMEALRKLDREALCTCPACVRRRQLANNRKP